jgi:ketosteroid isomerase-like protein
VTAFFLRFALCLLMLMCLPAARLRADENIRAAQLVLKEKKFFYGTVNGRLDKETYDAIRRFQIKEGLDVTGKLDAVTLQSLALREPSAITSVLPAASPPANADIQAAISRRTAPNPEPSALSTGAISISPSPPPVDEEGDLNEQVAKFLHEYLAARAAEDLEGEMIFYADPVSYFSRRTLKRDALRKRLQEYRRQWHQRQSGLDGEPQVLPYSNDGTVALRYRLLYNLLGGRRQRTGRSETTMILRGVDPSVRPAGPRFEILSISEKRLRQ